MVRMSITLTCVLVFKSKKLDCHREEGEGNVVMIRTITASFVVVKITN